MNQIYSYIYFILGYRFLEKLRVCFSTFKEEEICYFYKINVKSLSDLFISKNFLKNCMFSQN